MSVNREWMYRRFLADGALNPDFQRGLQGFIDYASSRRDLMDGEKIRCPCRKCDNIRFHTKNNLQYHIAKNGFVRDYHIWRFHGEIEIPTPEYHNFEDIEDNEDNQEKVQEIVASRSQPVDDESDPPKIDMSKVYVEAVGGLDKKKRMFGVGGLATSFRSEESSGTSVFQGPTVDPQRIVELEQQLQEALRQKDDFMARFEAQQEEQRQRDEQQRATNEAMQTQLHAQQRLIEMITSRLPPPGPPGPSGPS